MGEALCRLLERVPADRLPQAGGVSATVVVLLDYDKLLTGLGAAQLDTGDAVSAGLARRLLCEAGVVPAVYRRVLGGPSVVLDVGRQARLHTGPNGSRWPFGTAAAQPRGATDPRAGRRRTTTRWPGPTAAARALTTAGCSAASTTPARTPPTYETTRLPNGKIRFHRRT